MFNTKFITQHNTRIGICRYNILCTVLQPPAATVGQCMNKTYIRNETCTLNVMKTGVGGTV